MSRTTIKKEITSTIYTNTNRSVTGNALQGVLTDMVDDVYDNVSPFERGTGSNSIVVKGKRATASGDGSFAEGSDCTASGQDSYAEGTNNTAAGNFSHVEGGNNITSAPFTHAEGRYTTAAADLSHTEGTSTTAFGYCSHAEGGSGTTASSNNISTSTSIDSIISNWGTLTSDNTKYSLAKGTYSHVEGRNSLALGDTSHAEGHTTYAEGDFSHSECNDTRAIGNSSHAEGWNTEASGLGAHSEGAGSIASGYAAHAEGGYGCVASGVYSHAEGYTTTASGGAAHVEGAESVAGGDCSHAEGECTVTSNEAEHAEGIYNKSNQRTNGTDAQNAAGSTIHSVGVGEEGTQADPDINRKNAFEIMQNGDVYIKGVGTYNGTNPTSGTNDVATILTGLSNKTYATTIAADNGTNQLTLLSNTKYKLTAGGSNFIFTTPTGGSDVYWCDNNTTYNDCLTAFNNGKVPILKRKDPYDEDDLMLIGEYRHDSGFFQFSCIGVSADQIWTQKLVSGSGWGNLEYKTVGVQYPAGKYSCVKSGGSGIDNVFCDNGNIIAITSGSGTFTMSLSNFYSTFMKSIGGYDSIKESAMTDGEKITELAYAIAGCVILKQPSGTGLMTQTDGSYFQVVINSSTNPDSISSFTYGGGASTTRFLVDSSGFTLTIP